MNDTPEAVETRYRAMLMALSGPERLAMGGRMHRTARALMRAGILAELGPDADEAEVRRRIFLRLYGDDLAEPHRSRALERVIAATKRPSARPDY